MISHVVHKETTVIIECDSHFNYRQRKMLVKVKIFIGFVLSVDEKLIFVVGRLFCCWCVAHFLLLLFHMFFCVTPLIQVRRNISRPKTIVLNQIQQKQLCHRECNQQRANHWKHTNQKKICNTPSPNVRFMWSYSTWHFCFHFDCIICRAKKCAKFAGDIIYHKHIQYGIE